MLPVGVPCHVVVRVFRRMMRLRRYMLRSVHVRLLAVDRLMALRRACEFRTGNTIRWGKWGASLFVFFVVLIVPIDRRMGDQAFDSGRQWWYGASGHAHDRAAAASSG
jgi:hypothetical protein